MGIDAEMFVRVRGPVSDDDLRKAEHEVHCHFYPKEMSTHKDRFLERVEKWEQDGPDILPEEGETFIRAVLWTRYYGPGYERGNFRFIHDLAEVLERAFPGGEVWYGGDSSGVEAERFGPEERAELRKHWLEHAHRPYQRSNNPFMPPEGPGPECRKCKVTMQRNGWGAGYAAYFCECGERHVTRDGEVKVTSYEDRTRRKSELQRLAFKELEKTNPEAARELADLEW